MTQHIALHNRLHDRTAKIGKGLQGFIRSHVQKRWAHLGEGVQQPYWNADFFGLPRLSAAAAMAPAEQQLLLQRLNQYTLEEAFYIEKTGMFFTAKMALLAESNEERSLYCLMAADESAHFQLVCSFLQEQPGLSREQPFVGLLSHMIEEGGYGALIFVTQVLLEGWGLSHYKDLLKYCLHPELQQVFRTILQDEAVHHGSGLVLAERRPIAAGDRDLTTAFLEQFFQLVVLGPLAAARGLNSVAGLQDVDDYGRLFTDTCWHEVGPQQARHLVKFVQQHCSDPLIVGHMERFIEQLQPDARRFGVYCQEHLQAS